MLSLGLKVGCQSVPAAKTESSCDGVLFCRVRIQAGRQDHPKIRTWEEGYGLGLGLGGRQGRGKTRGDGRPRRDGDQGCRGHF